MVRSVIGGFLERVRSGKLGAVAGFQVEAHCCHVREPDMTSRGALWRLLRDPRVAGSGDVEGDRILSAPIMQAPRGWGERGVRLCREGLHQFLRRVLPGVVRP